MSTATLVGAPIVDQTTSTSRTRAVSVVLVDLERPSGARVFVRVAIEDDNEKGPRGIDLEPEQARRLAAILEHGADVADREPVGIVRRLVEQLDYYDGNSGRSAASKPLEDARAWLKRHDPT